MAKEDIKILRYKEDNNNTQDVHSSLAPVSKTPKEIIRYTCRRKRKQAPSNNIGKEVKTNAFKRAEEIQASLNPKFPSFVKYMMPSHVSSCYWLGLPQGFCKSYMPKQDETMMLKAEDGNEYPVQFLAVKTGLSGGWRGFSILHRLVEGDVVVFHLIRETKFKVYIARQNELGKVDGALSLLGLNSGVEQTDAGKIIKTGKIYQKQYARSVPRAILGESSNRSSSPAVLSGLELALPTETKFLESKQEFKDIKDAENFSITVNGSNIDTQIPASVKTKYYNLCRSQNAFLHEYLPKVINNKLVAGIISETVNIADAIVASKLTTSQKECRVWDKSLLAFQKLGMNVDFLRSRLQRLMGLAQATETKKYTDAVLGKSQVEEEIQVTELKLAELRKASKSFGAEIEAFKVKAERHEQKFRCVAAAHW